MGTMQSKCAYFSDFLGAIRNPNHNPNPSANPKPSTNPNTSSKPKPNPNTNENPKQPQKAE